MTGYGDGTYGDGTYGGTGVITPPAGNGDRDAGEAVVAVSGDVYVAPVGTTLPSFVRGPLHPDFYNVGYITEEGASLAWAPEVDEQEGWQEQMPIRRDVAQQRIAVTFDMVQWNEETVLFAFGGGHVVEWSLGQFRYDFPEPDQRAVERSLVLDWEDHDRPFRLVFKRGTVLQGLTTTFQRGTMARLPVGFDVLAADDNGSPGYMLFTGEPGLPTGTDPPLFGTGSFGSGVFGG